MVFSVAKKEAIKEVLKHSISNKLKTYNPETAYMPFHHRLLGKDRMALFSFIQSLNTTFGTSIYEPVAMTLAEGRFVDAKKQAPPHDFIGSEAQVKVQRILDEISTAVRTPDKSKELREIREASKRGKLNQVRLSKIDIWLQGAKGELYFIDLKTVKPNIEGFAGHKRKLLEWAAAEMSRTPDVKIKTLIGIPYNPYYPRPYERWTMRGMFDLKEEVLVDSELWDFIGGKGAYGVLLDCFEEAGIELRSELDRYFNRFKG